MTHNQIPLVDLKAQYASIKDEIKETINRVLDSTQFIMGDEAFLFEKEFAKFCGSKYCTGVSSGTSALHLALLACGIGPNDEVITVPFTFIATAEAISHVGAKVVFVDIEPNTYTIDINKLEKSITKNTKAIIPVHLYGHPANMMQIIEIAKKYNLKVIEDAAQAHGAKINGKSVGTFGDVGCFSFFPAKNLGAYGDGGACITNNDEIAKQIYLLRDHGRTKKHLHEVKGFNYRLDALQAAILRVKLKYLPTWIETRRKLALSYRELLSKLPITIPFESPGYYHAYHLYVIQSKIRDLLQSELKKQGIQTGIHYSIPLHLQPAYKDLGYKKGDFPVSESSSETVLSLPLYPELTNENQLKIVQAIKEELKIEISV